MVHMKPVVPVLLPVKLTGWLQCALVDGDMLSRLVQIMFAQGKGSGIRSTHFSQIQLVTKLRVDAGADRAQKRRET